MSPAGPRSLLACALLLLGLSAAGARAACITDDTAALVCLENPPRRVISLYGAFTELLWDLGIRRELVARTSNDVTIEETRGLPSLGTGLRPDLEHLIALRPELVVSRGGKAAAGTVGMLRERGVRVAAFDPSSVASLEETVERLGTLCGREAQARTLNLRMRKQLDEASDAVGQPTSRLRVVYEVRAEPLTVAGTQGLVDEIIGRAGGVNAVQNEKKLVLLDVEALLRLDPDVYVIQEGPMNRNPVAPEDRPHFRLLRAVRDGRVLRVEEEDFARPGPRVADAVIELSRFLYPARWAGR